jgi:hypothetical protein
MVATVQVGVREQSEAAGRHVRWCYVAAESVGGLCYAVGVIDAAKLGETDKETAAAGFVWGAGDVTHTSGVCLCSHMYGRAFLSCHRCSFSSCSGRLRSCPLGVQDVKRAR